MNPHTPGKTRSLVMSVCGIIRAAHVKFVMDFKLGIILSMLRDLP